MNVGIMPSRFKVLLFFPWIFFGAVKLTCPRRTLSFISEFLPRWTASGSISQSQEQIFFPQTYHTYATNTPSWKPLGNLHNYHWGTDSGNTDARNSPVHVKMQLVSHRHRPQASAGKKNNLVSIFFLLFTWSFQEPSLNKLFTIAEIL